MNEARTRTSTSWPLAAGAGLALGLAAAALGPGGPQARVSVALLLVLAAVAVAVGVPWAASRPAGAGRALRGCAAFLLAILVGGGLLLPPGGLALGLLYLLLLALPLAALSARLGPGSGPFVAGGLGLALLALPYYADPLLLGLGNRGALTVVLASPLPVLSGSCAGVDLLRTATLYRLFSPGQAVSYAYLAPGLALLPALLAAAAGAAALLAPRWRPRPGVVACAVLLLLLAAPTQEASAQVIPPADPGAQSPEIGDLVTRVRLGYWALPNLGGRFILDGHGGLGGSRFSLRRTLDLNQELVVPTFEVNFSWENAGNLTIQYIEGSWKGESQIHNNFRFEEQLYPNGFRLDTRYRYRTIAVGGELDIPVFDWATLKIVTTQRYFKHEVTMKGFGASTAFSSHNSFEGLIPTIGVGADVLVWNIIAVYGNVQWLDFRTSLFGGQDKRLTFKYREWRAGVRLELVEHAHVLVEWYSLETMVRKGFDELKEEYRQQLNGVRVQVAVLF